VSLRLQALSKRPVLAVAAFWYISLFPGRLPFDSSDAIRMLQRGESTEQWTPLFFWLLKLFTIDGRVIYVSSFLIAIGFLYSFNYLVKSISVPTEHLETKILFWTSITPIYGFWSVTVSHDSTFVIGFVMTIAILLRITSNQVITVRKREALLAAVFLLTSWVGYVLCVILLLSLFFLKYKNWLFVFVGVLLFASTAPLGISSTRSDVIFRPFLVDMKCVVQHDEAVVSQQTWQALQEIAPRERWENPVSCSSMDSAVHSLYSSTSNLSNLRWSKILPSYLQLLKDNPAIVIVGHIQRSSVALPPILFQPPKNQVSWDLSLPVGFGTNTMIQQGPEVIHPSIDEKSVDINVPFQIYFEIPAQLLAFLVNQASWFWGWGGLWIIPFIYLIHSRFALLGIRRLKFTYAQLLVFHLMMFALMPDPTPRYVLPSLLLGNFATVALLVLRKSRLNQPNP
jgi:hypothetical protein